MASRKSGWAPYPYDTGAFDYAGDKLKKAWRVLHAGDNEPYPDRKRAAALLAGLAKPPGSLDADRLTESLQEAWRAFHRGDFQRAAELGEALGPLGASVACKAIGIHATHLVDDEKVRLDRYQRAVTLAEAAVEALPGEANSHYRLAFALGRYSQGISIAKALAQGLAGRVRESLESALELDADHAEAHTAFALYHAEIIGKVGAMIGGLTYGAKSAEADKHMKAALKLAPKSPIAHIEHGNMLLLLHGDKQEDAAAEAYERAAGLAPNDAMEKLDVEFARSQLE